MKNRLILLSLAAVSAAVGASAAEPLTAMKWDFGTSANPSVVKPADANPFNATGTTSITPGAGIGYSSGIFLGDPGFGTATGLWDILNGSVTLGLDMYPATPATTLDYSLVVNHFASPAPGFPYSSELFFSIPGAQLISQITKESPTEGFWIESTYTWQQLTVSGTIELTVTGKPNSGFLMDALAFYVAGSLTPIPEPSVAQLGVAAAFMFGLFGMRNRKQSA
jgi:hypothetical protein